MILCVLIMTGIIRGITVFVLNIIELVLTKTWHVLNMIRFVIDMTGFDDDDESN